MRWTPLSHLGFILLWCQGYPTCWQHDDGDTNIGAGRGWLGAGQEQGGWEIPALTHNHPQHPKGVMLEQQKDPSSLLGSSRLSPRPGWVRQQLLPLPSARSAQFEVNLGGLVDLNREPPWLWSTDGKGMDPVRKVGLAYLEGMGKGKR